jgi:hypothetical protein
MRYFISIDYNEPNTDEYKSVDCSERVSDKTKKFDSGDFGKDWFDMIKHIIMTTTDDTFSATYSSSVDHFIMDGAKYDSAYLHFDDEDEPFLDYENFDGIELFVSEGTKPTWEELKDMYNEK